MKWLLKLSFGQIYYLINHMSNSINTLSVKKKMRWFLKLPLNMWLINWWFWSNDDFKSHIFIWWTFIWHLELLEYRWSNLDGKNLQMIKKKKKKEKKKEEEKKERSNPTWIGLYIFFSFILFDFFTFCLYNILFYY